MTQDEIIEMARQAGFVIDDMCYVRFAKLVAAKEREACALVCEAHSFRVRGFLDNDLLECKLADAIRARGEA